MIHNMRKMKFLLDMNENPTCHTVTSAWQVVTCTWILRGGSFRAALATCRVWRTHLFSILNAAACTIRVYQLTVFILVWTILKNSNRNCFQLRGSWRAIDISNPRLFSPVQTVLPMSGILRTTCRFARDAQCSAHLRTSTLAFPTRVRHYHLAPSNFAQHSRTRPFLKDAFPLRIVRRAQRSVEASCWRTRSRNLHSSAGVSYFRTFVYPAYSSCLPNSVLHHMGIDRPAPGTGCVLIMLVSAFILLISLL